MNRFKIVLGKEKAFEDVWETRETHLENVPGFKKFNLVKGEKKEDPGRAGACQGEQPFAGTVEGAEKDFYRGVQNVRGQGDRRRPLHFAHCRALVCTMHGRKSQYSDTGIV